MIRLDEQTTLNALMPVGRMRAVSGFGFTSRSDGFVYRPTSPDEMLELFRLAQATGRPICLRGAAEATETRT